MMEPQLLEARTSEVVARIEDGHDSTIKTNDLAESPKGTSSNGIGREDKRPKEENNGSHVVDIKSPEGTSSNGIGREDKRPKEENNGSHVVDIKNNEEHLRAEKICRICHLSNEPSSGSSELIQLGCHCREELGISHRLCAETWFKQRGNRLCEICNKTAKNVRLIKDTRIYIMEFNDVRPMSATSFDSPGDGSRRCKQSCNFLLACLVLAFLVSTFVRAKIL